MNSFWKAAVSRNFLNFNLQDGLWSKCCKQPKIRGRQCYFSNWGFGPKCSSGRAQCVIFIEIIFSRASRPSVHLQIVRRIFGGCQSSGRFKTECNETSSQSFIKGTFQVNYFLKSSTLWPFFFSFLKYFTQISNRHLNSIFIDFSKTSPLPGHKEIYKVRIFWEGHKI